MTSIVPLNRGWEFRRLPALEAGPAVLVDLPHNPTVADLDGRDPWLGLCEYRRELAPWSGSLGSRCVLHVGAAMHTAVVFLDGKECGSHSGGYLPFEIDLTAQVSDGKPHSLCLRLDNRDNPDVPPGKPSDELDFCWHGGLYREVELRTYPEVHFTDPVGADSVAGGGIFVRTLSASSETATLSVKAQVRNEGSQIRPIRVAVELFQAQTGVDGVQSEDCMVGALATTEVEVALTVSRPKLWCPASPHLYQLRIRLLDPDGRTLDERRVRYGIRRIAFSRSKGFEINGERRRFRGTNRHQEYPRVGYAVPEAAQRRDAVRIKEAGYDYVRVAHYPQSPAFLDACDELGILVMNAIPGWQYLGGARFREACFQNARDLIRRDRNHPCVVLWELSLNETEMDEAFMARLHAIGHEEYPGDQMFTCGWQDRYDVYLRSRQHGGIHTWQNGDKALVIAEYGDWEFYAANEGFDQKTGQGLYPAAENARKLRGDGEAGLRKQSQNHLIALNDTLRSPAVLDGHWVMFDYTRGYDPHRASCGVMDIFRLPKFSYYFYRSQRDPGEGRGTGVGGPMVYIASHWLPVSSKQILVFTNCDEVELQLDGISLARRKPERSPATVNLPHPPCVFELPNFVPGTLQAIGFLEGRRAASHQVTTPTRPRQLALEIDYAGITAAPDQPDVLLAHARIEDGAGTLCVTDSSIVAFEIEGDGEIVGPPSTSAEAGIASIVVRVPPNARGFTLQATADLEGSRVRVVAHHGAAASGLLPKPQPTLTV